MALCVGVLGYGLAVTRSAAIFPNVFVAGVDVGGMRRPEAADAIAAAVAETYGRSTLAVQLADRTLALEPKDTKATLDAVAAAESAWHYGRDQGLFHAISARLSASSGSHTVDSASVHYDEQYVRSLLEAVAAEVRSERRDSSYELSAPPPAPDQPDAAPAPAAKPRELTIQVGSSARSLNVNGLEAAIREAYLGNNFAPVKFPYDETPYTPVDLDTLYNDLRADMADAFYDAEKKEIVPDVAGYGFDLEAEKQRQAMADEGSTLVITLAEIKPELTLADLEAKLFHDVLGAYASPHVYNPDRTTNLRLSCQAIDGTILNTGDVFSFNTLVGERTAAKGYKPATVYVSGESKPELGGGVCQVASTIYYATLLADLPVVERTEHMFSVTYVPMGMDATIYWGSLDYKFKNNTKYPLRIDAAVVDGKVDIKLVGTKESDKTVKMTYAVLSTAGWKDVEKVDETRPADYKQVTVTPYTGYTVQTYKQYLDKDGKALGEPEKVAYSKYQKRDRVTTIGKKEVVKPPEKPPVDPPVTPPVVEPPVVEPPVVPPVDPPVDPPIVPTEPGATDPGNSSGVLE